MNIFKRITDWRSKTKSFWIGFRSFFFSENVYRPTNKDYLDSYSSCHLVYASTKKIGEAVANVKRKLYSIKGSYNNEIIKEKKDHEILDLLAKPNKFMTGFELFKGISIDLDLMGNSYILKAKAQKEGKPEGKTLELWPLRPDWVKILPDEEEIIGGYEYRVPGGDVQTYGFDEVIHFKEMNPKSAFYGLPTVKPALEIIRSLVYAIRWNMNFFYNSARPDFVIFTENKMQPQDKKDFKKAWQSEFGGLEKSHRFGILSGKDVRIEKLTQTMRDMEFNKLTEVATNQILAAFGVPKHIIGMVGMNRAEADAQIYTFLSITIEPRYKMINEKLNEFLVQEFSDNLYLDYVDPTPENREALVKEYETALKNNWMVINEVRDKEGLPPLDGGWDFYLPVVMIPAGGVPEGERTKMFRIKGLNSHDYYKHQKAKEDEALRERVMTGKKKLKTTLKLTKELTKIFADRLKIIKELSFTDEKKQELWNEHDKLLTGDEKTFKAMVVKLFENQRKRVLETLKMEKQIINKAINEINWDKEKTLFAKVSTPFFTSIVEKRGKRAAALVGSTFEMTADVRKFIKNKTILFADQVNDTTRDKLKKTLSAGVAEGEGIPDLTKRVNDVFDSRTKWESERIARTEVLGSSNGAELEAYMQTDIVEKVEWSATMDDRTRPEHAAMNGEVVKKGKPFSNGLLFPSEVNCRCALLPVVD